MQKNSSEKKVGQKPGQKVGQKVGQNKIMTKQKAPKLLKLRDLTRCTKRRERFVNQTLLTRCN